MKLYSKHHIVMAVVITAAGSGTLTAYKDMGKSEIARFAVSPVSDWTEFTEKISIEDGVHPLYFIYRGTGTIELKQIVFS